ncbi:WASH complex subunit 1-like [Euwallacea fornicatus]|uniref:WASH complex subunit 1-like n=1 Tax=Euwallacea fornicatus TaxID=995702 RepID=UPI00338EAC04
MTSIKIQFLVQMTCDSCVKAVRKSLENVEGVNNVEVNLAQGSVVVDSTLPTLDILKRLESTGKLVAIKGYDGSIAAVSVLEAGDDSVKGVIRFVQATPDTCIIDGTIDGLRPGSYNIEVHECGDLSRGCSNVGNIFNPASYFGKRSYGSLGEVTAERNGRSKFRLEDKVLKLSDIIGRSFVVSTQFFHVKTSDQKKTSISEGLGDIPPDTKCINDLLLFNTGRNIYKNFKLGDSHEDQENINNNNNYYTTSELGPAPFSISQRSSMQHANKDNYFYTPKVEELPDLDVPWDLPDLPGIADDVRYEIDGSTIIALSAVNTATHNVELDLPDLMEVKADIETLLPVSVVPPPPPIEDIPILPPVHQVVEPPKEVKEHISEPKKPPSPPPVTILATNDSHASLMDAIRKAGGSQKANLRKTLEEPKNPRGPRKAAPAGDLMADLHSKLMMRRKGISGIKNPDQGSSTTDSTFARLSSIIPPPTKSSDAGSGVSTDEDAWNDDDLSSSSEIE